MFDSPCFGYPAIHVTFITISLGALFALFAWGKTVFDPKESGVYSEFSSVLYAFTASVLSEIIGIIFIVAMPDSLDLFSVMGVRLRLFVYIVFLALGFVFVLVSLMLTKGKMGPIVRLLRIGSIVLVIVNVLGIIGITLCFIRN